MKDCSYCWACYMDAHDPVGPDARPYGVHAQALIREAYRWLQRYFDAEDEKLPGSNAWRPADAIQRADGGRTTASRQAASDRDRPEQQGRSPIGVNGHRSTADGSFGSRAPGRTLHAPSRMWPGGRHALSSDAPAVLADQPSLLDVIPHEQTPLSSHAPRKPVTYRGDCLRRRRSGPDRLSARRPSGLAHAASASRTARNSGAQSSSSPRSARWGCSATASAVPFRLSGACYGLDMIIDESLETQPDVYFEAGIMRLWFT